MGRISYKTARKKTKKRKAAKRNKDTRQSKSRSQELKKPPKTQDRKILRSYDIAYGSLLFLGLMTLWIAYNFPWEGLSDSIAFAFLGLLGTPGISMAIAIILFAWFAFKSKDMLLILMWLLTLILLPFGALGAVPLIVYGALAVIFSTWWFAFARRKKKRQA